MHDWTPEDKLTYWFETGKVEPGFDVGFRWKAEHEEAVRRERERRVEDWVRESGRERTCGGLDQMEGCPSLLII
jgi:hypothetical protein